ncbi:uncharacterized protein LOC121639895 isoform X2 [Melanotaenia boesemani]|uniref:uncharacterized protein LOC121639895 isoform X2 n=1 Tax=Melanotaenia boesemani TaxID=1250792 RepID=UPI001C04E603|nr:uncharacterized protein LOC121639895 isoform X2 [Melanotaenia boesemani]
MQLYHHSICSMMNAPIFALYFTCLLVENKAHLAAPDGGSVSLECLCKDGVEVMSYWYKQILGRSPKLMSTFYKNKNNSVFEEEFNNWRFSPDTRNTGKLMLEISDLRTSDSATYYCAMSNLYDFEFCDGTTVSVKSSGLSFQTLVHQSETITAEVSETLNCAVYAGTRDAEQGVYWFKAIHESHVGIIHTHGDRNDCVYDLPMKNLKVSCSGIVYCAVASCGRMLFGNRTKLDSEDEVEFHALVYVLSGALAFATMLAVILTFLVYKLSQRNCLDSATSLGPQV